MEAIRAIGLTYKNSDGSIGAISDATESDNNMLFYSKSEADAEIARLGIKYSNAKTSAEFFKSALEEANKINERLEAEVERLKEAICFISEACKVAEQALSEGR